MDHSNSNLTHDQAEKLAEKALNNVMTKIATVLTDEDMETIEALEEKDPSGEAVKYFIISKVPNFSALLEKELVDLSLNSNN